jgi:hypothetical protein
MRGHEWLAAILAVLTIAGWVSAGEPAQGEPGLTGRWAVTVTDTPPDREHCWLHRLAPAGGWFPYGCLLHWWNPCWSPRGGAPDDYCRKPLPPFGCSPCSHYSVLDLREHGSPDNKRP